MDFSTIPDNKVIYYGTGRVLNRLSRHFYDLFAYAEKVVDRSPRKNYLGGDSVPLVALGDMSPSAFAGRTVVMTIKNREEASRTLNEQYGVPYEKIIPIQDWIVYLLRQRLIIIRSHSVRIEVCSLCQLNCRDCYMRHGTDKIMGLGYMPVDKFNSILEENPYIDECELSNNGEVFLHPYLHDILRIAREHGVSVWMKNGVNMNTVNENVLEELVSGNVKEILVSIDGASDDTYPVYRRNGSFSKVISNIKKINELKKERNIEYPKLMWQFVMMKHNVHEIQKARELASELGMGIVYKRSWNPSEAEAVDRMLAQNSLTLDSRNSFPSQSTEDQSKLPVYEIHYCNDMIFTPQINWDGRILGCCSNIFKGWNGNVFRDGLIASVNADDYINAVIDLMDNNSPDEDNPCALCIKNDLRHNNGELFFKREIALY